jgi:hypothetical protein
VREIIRRKAGDEEELSHRSTSAQAASAWSSSATGCLGLYGRPSMVRWRHWFFELATRLPSLSGVGPQVPGTASVRDWGWPAGLAWWARLDRIEGSTSGRWAEHRHSVVCRASNEHRRHRSRPWVQPRGGATGIARIARANRRVGVMEGDATAGVGDRSQAVQTTCLRSLYSVRGDQDGPRNEGR